MSNRTVRPWEPNEQVRPVRPDDTQQVRPLPYYSDVAREDTGAFIAIVELDLDDGTEYYSHEGVNAPDREYLDYVVAIGAIHREFSIYTGGMSIGNVTVTFHNRAQFWSRKLREQDFRGRALRIKYVNQAKGLASALTLYEGQILRWRLAGGQLEMEARDLRYDELFDSPISQSAQMITRLNFADLPGSQVPVMAPWVYGRIGSVSGLASAAQPGGSCRSFLVQENASPGDAYVYALAARPLSSAGMVAEFYLYGVHQAGTIETRSYNSNDYMVSRYASSQRDVTRPDEMEITGFFNGFTEDDAITSAPILNWVRALEHALDNYSSLDLADFDTALQTTAKDLAASQGYADDRNGQNPAVLGVYVDDHEMSKRQLVEKFCESFAGKFFPTRAGLFATVQDTDGAPPSADFEVDDERDIIAGSFTVESNPEIATVIQVNHCLRSTSGRAGDPGPGQYFERQPDYKIPGARTQLGDTYDVRRNLNLWFVRNTQKAYEVARAVAEYYKPNAEWVTFEIPLLNFWRRADLNKHVGITHWQGPSLERNSPRGAYIGYDEFARANSNSLGSNWTETEYAASTTVFSILSEQLRMTVDSSNRSGFALIAGTFSSRQVARAKFVLHADTVGLTGAKGGVIVRGKGTISAFHGFAALIIGQGTSGGGGSLQLHRYAGVTLNNASTGGTNLGSVAANGAAGSVCEPGDTIELRVKEVGGSAVLEVWVISDDADRNGLQIGPITTTTITDGVPGFMCHYNGAGSERTFDWDDFVALSDWTEQLASGYENIIGRIVAIDLMLQPSVARMRLKCFHRPEFRSADDAFTAANGNTLPAGWTESEYAAVGTVFSILSNQLRITMSATERSGLALRDEGFTQDQLARARFVGSNFAHIGADTGPTVGLVVRGQGTVDSFTGFAAFLIGQGSSGTLRLWRLSASNLNNATITNGVTVLGSVAANGATSSKFEIGDELEIRVEEVAGSAVINVYVISQNSFRNGLAIGPITATTIAGGVPGFFGHWGGTLVLSPAVYDWDDFHGRDF